MRSTLPLLQRRAGFPAGGYRPAGDRDLTGELAARGLRGAGCGLGLYGRLGAVLAAARLAVLASRRGTGPGLPRARTGGCRSPVTAPRRQPGSLLLGENFWLAEASQDPHHRDRIGGLRCARLALYEIPRSRHERAPIARREPIPRRSRETAQVIADELFRCGPHALIISLPGQLVEPLSRVSRRRYNGGSAGRKRGRSRAPGPPPVA
jgi:hypothetical protein